MYQPPSLLMEKTSCKYCTFYNTTIPKSTTALTFLLCEISSLDDDEAKKVLLRAHKEGHQIASHTWSHKDLTTISGREFDSEVNALENAVSRIIGERLV